MANAYPTSPMDKLDEAGKDRSNDASVSSDSSGLSSIPANTATRDEKKYSDDLPRLPFDFRSNIPKLIPRAFPLLLLSGIWPIIAYTVLTNCTDLTETIVLTLTTVPYGAVTVLSLSIRTYQMLRDWSIYRPINTSTTGEGSKWQLDVFHWNFIAGFLYSTVIISIGIALTPPINVHVTSMALSLLLIHICGLMVLFQILYLCGVKTPFTLSSLPKGSDFTSAVFIIVEDVIAVEGRQAQKGFRSIWMARWNASPEFRVLMRRLDWVWGVMGLTVATAVIAIVWSVDDPTVGLCVGFAAPWVYVGVMIVVTTLMVKKTLKLEEESLSRRAGAV